MLGQTSTKQKKMTEQIAPTERTKLKRIPKRGAFDRRTIYRILDEGLVCHVGFVFDGRPFVIPTGYARIGDDLVIHGSSASRMLRALSGEIEICLTVTLLDGLVLARSAFHHSMNYRSVVIFGRAGIIDDPEEKLAALRAFTEHIVPGRWPEIRGPNPLEMKATTVLRLPIEEASAKIRTGDPVDDEEDYDMDVWAGVIPLNLAAGKPVDDERAKPGIEPPDHVLNYRR
ncbi:MAG: pyridoxamine 5'-phosphate oxidase family protein [Pyrinomonadaceae bacterium]